MQIIRAAGCPVMPWKNDGGSTTEIAVSPAGASLENFDWRVSMARVASDGPFSNFAGIDRTLAIVEGNGLILSIGNRPDLTLAGEPAQISFPGDVRTVAWLISGEITDLNVMTRRGRFSHSLQRLRQPTALDFAGHDTAVILALNGSVAVGSKHDTRMLEHGDAAVLTRSNEAAFRIAPAIISSCYLILLRDEQG